MKKLLGSDTTLDALKWQARRWKAGGMLLANAVAAGIDPKDINCDVNPQGKPDGAVSGKHRSTCAYFLPLFAQHFKLYKRAQNCYLPSHVINAFYSYGRLS
jgi:hypothetical protein